MQYTKAFVVFSQPSSSVLSLTLKPFIGKPLVHFFVATPENLEK